MTRLKRPASLTFKKESDEDIVDDLKRKDYASMLRLMIRMVSIIQPIQPRCDYDLYFDITPYDNSVQKTYGLEHYVNASFIDVDGDKFIACQAPKPDYYDDFLDLLQKSDANCVICLDPKNCGYLDRCEAVGNPKSEMIDGCEFIIDEEYKVGEKTLRVIKCNGWEDHMMLDRNKMEKLWEYTNDLAKEEMKIVHCKAGSGRVGTFIMFRVLKRIQEIEKVITPKRFIDIWHKMRMQRTMVVQSIPQLEFLVEYFIEEEEFVVNEPCEKRKLTASSSI